VKVLFVSDSLGSPIEQRGIHNFSVSLIENLRGLGAEVSLVVERSPGRWYAGRMRSRVVDVNETRKSIALAEVMRYFAERRYNLGWIHRWAEAKSTPAFVKSFGAWAYVGFVRQWAGGPVTVDNKADAVDFVPTNSAHLSLPSQFVVVPAVYSEMMMRAMCNLPPLSIDGRGYDLVIIDTPSYVKIEGIDSNRILSVVHDLIPLRDPTMSAHWRALFFKKLEAVMAQNPNFAFVSEYSRNIFIQSFPRYQMRRSVIYYPTLRKSLVRRAAAGLKKAYRRYAPSEVANLESSVALQDRLDKDQGYDSVMEQNIALSARYERAARLRDAYVRVGWNTQLPYFVTVVSDEPRKNIGLLMKAFDALKGRANMVVLGNIDGGRYVGGDANAKGNIRFTGYVSETEKMRIIAMSDGLIFPSFTEGFGIPLIEGALYDKPVLCSDIDVFREVAGEDAVYFNPYQEDSLVATIEDVLADPLVSHERALRLKARVLERFTLDAAAVRLKGFLSEIGLLQGLETPQNP
jgi:glycosyltransferase involved in cell wall biosynthesis